jgi:hypothetical protein
MVRMEWPCRRASERSLQFSAIRVSERLAARGETWRTGGVEVGAVGDDASDADVEVGEVVEKLGRNLGRIGEAVDVDPGAFRQLFGQDPADESVSDEET